MNEEAACHILSGNQSSVLILATKGTSPRLVYWGKRLPDDVNPQSIIQLLTRQGTQGGADIEVPVSLSCEPGSGYAAPFGLEVHRNGLNWDINLATTSVHRQELTVTVECNDNKNNLKVSYKITLDPTTDVIKFHTSIKNTGDAPLIIDWAATACLPLPFQFNEVINFEGKWANEFQTKRFSIEHAGFILENLRGRTSHDRFPGLIFCTPQTNERTGDCLGIHLGWSGNHRLRVDRLSDGRSVLQSGERLLPGERQLLAGETYTPPPLYTQFSPHGLSALSQGFHDYYHNQLVADRIREHPRPVHYNSWEAIYFDHDQDRLANLIEKAATLGIERFVLDDGWFKGRRNDQTGLGDWEVDPAVYPDGLQGLIDLVKQNHMTFGLWVEPEMVNADSNLFRTHPDWILGPTPEEQIPFRNQYVLDFTNEEVFNNIFTQIDKLLSTYPDIAYLKWDMNRDINHPSSSNGKSVTSAQTNAVYQLIDKVRSHHKTIEIENCSSGGGRADFGMLERTDRLWTSDSNDALDRQLIQKGASYFFPLSILGAHVGPTVCKVTGRTLSMGLRSMTAMFGAMGVEANLLDMTDTDHEDLKTAIALFKQYRPLIHDGLFFRVDGPSFQNTMGVVARDQSAALFSYVQLRTMAETLPPILKFPGLAPDRNYRLKVIWPQRLLTPPPFRLENSGLMTDGYEASGALLEKVGLQIPLLNPETGLIFQVQSIS